jgi:aspartyl-tRNA synthetase
VGQTVVFRARLTSSRVKGKLAFLVVRQRTHSVQVYIPVRTGGASQQMINWIQDIPVESILLIEGVVCSSNWEITGASVKNMEINGEKVRLDHPCAPYSTYQKFQIYLISSPEGILPFNLADASRAESDFEKDDVQYNRVLLESRLNNRVLDLRV